MNEIKNLVSWSFVCVCVGEPTRGEVRRSDYLSMYVLWLAALNNRRCQHQQYDRQHSPLQCILSQ